MEDFFTAFSLLLKLMQDSYEEDREIDFVSASQILDQMEQLCLTDRRLKPQLSNVQFYRSSIQRLFGSGSSRGHKLSFLESLMEERDALEKFARDNKLY